MKPLSLHLKGFTGISSGRGKAEITLDFSSIPNDAALVALTGPNGTGKTTIMENLHPYRLMPSRASGLTPGSFSYWDNLNANEACKTLVWEHAGRVYKTELVFRSTPKTRKQDCYLLVQDGQGFKPVTLPDGTVSDGKTDTYDRCVEAIVGRPDLYFTAAFASQNRRSLSAYSAGEIKAIFSAALNLDHLRELSLKAQAVAKAMKSSLVQIQAGLRKREPATAQIQTAQAQIASCDEAIASTHAQLANTAEQTEQIAKRVAQLEVARDQAAAQAEQRQRVLDLIASAQKRLSDQTNQVRQQTNEQVAQLIAARQSDQTANTAARSAVQTVTAQIARAQAVIKDQDAIRAASQAVKSLSSEIDVLVTKAAESRKAVQTLQSEVEALQDADGNWAASKSNGQAQAQVLERLKLDAKLSGEVPCHTQKALQTACPLLQQALAAGSKISAQEQALLDCRQTYRDQAKRVEQLQAKRASLKQLQDLVRADDQALATLQARLRQQTELAARAEMLHEAQTMVPQLQAQIAAQQALVQQTQERIAAHDAQLKSVQARLAEHLDALNRDHAVEQETLNRQLQQFLAFDASLLQKALADKAALAQQAAQANARLSDLQTRRATAQAAIEQAQVVLAECDTLAKRIEAIENEVAQWTLLGKALGNDGLIALLIDDAGPQIAHLCNRLLDECYGGRFAVRLDTQKDTQNGTAKETFEIVVHDRDRGEQKPLDLMSGGEGVWVNECLTKAIALYLAQSNNTTFETLFSDEADGPLDPERKRQFIDMKRAVLKSGGYQREFFISQTPELWELADHVIDVSTL